MALQGGGHASVERDGQVGGLRAALLMAHQGGGHAAVLSSPLTLSGDGQADYGRLNCKTTNELLVGFAGRVCADDQNILSDIYWGSTRWVLFGTESPFPLRVR
jgi:hypothetical protein